MGVISDITLIAGVISLYSSRLNKRSAVETIDTTKQTMIVYILTKFGMRLIIAASTVVIQPATAKEDKKLLFVSNLLWLK